ncbi:MAG: hypothetical protein STSR0004_13770 [Peptococcaceae bacterium]
MSQLKQNRLTNVETVDSRWKGLCKVGGMAALTMLVLMAIQIRFCCLATTKHRRRLFRSVSQQLASRAIEP